MGKDLCQDSEQNLPWLHPGMLCPGGDAQTGAGSYTLRRCPVLRKVSVLVKHPAVPSETTAAAAVGEQSSTVVPGQFGRFWLRYVGAATKIVLG